MRCGPSPGKAIALLMVGLALPPHFQPRFALAQRFKIEAGRLGVCATSHVGPLMGRIRPQLSLKPRSNRFDHASEPFLSGIPIATTMPDEMKSDLRQRDRRREQDQFPSRRRA